MNSCALAAITDYLDSLLQPALFQDSALNGLQVESANGSVCRVALAVDAGASVITKAIAARADMLIVHHGIFWGQCEAIRGTLGSKVRSLLNAGCSLYASHLPLDAHAEVGNNFELARFFALEQTQPFFPYKGASIGARGQTASSLDLAYFEARAKQLTGATAPLCLPFGKKSINTVGIVSGAAAAALPIAASDGLDLLITGEPKQNMYHHAKELGINVICAGHYATETCGVMAVGRKLATDLGLSTFFIDEPTGI